MDTTAGVDQGPPSPLLLLTQEISGGDVEATREVTAWLRNANEDQDKYARAAGLAECLEKTGHVAYVDWKQESDDTLQSLDRVSRGRLSESSLYLPLLERFQQESLGIAAYIDHPLPDPQLLELAKAAGFHLEGIDEGSDAYAFVLISTERRDRVYQLADEAGIPFYFRRRRKQVADEESATGKLRAGIKTIDAKLSSLIRYLRGDIDY